MSPKRDIDNHLTLTVTAEFAAPVERVWAAYSDPRQLERFWGPPGWPATFTAWNYEVGGKAQYTMNGPRGEKSTGTWEFLAIDAPRRFEVLDSFANEDGTPLDGFPSMRMTFEFTPAGDSTHMSPTTFFDSQDPRANSIVDVLRDALRR